MTEQEGRNIMEKVVMAVKALGEEDRQIIHRDLHQKNVMIHFKGIEPTEEDFDEPEHFFTFKLKALIRKSA